MKRSARNLMMFGLIALFAMSVLSAGAQTPPCAVNIANSSSLHRLRLNMSLDDVTKILTGVTSIENKAIGREMIIVEFVEPFDNRLDGAKVKNRVVGSLASTEAFGGFKGVDRVEIGFIDGTAVTVYASFLNPGKWTSFNDFFPKASKSLKLPDNWSAVANEKGTYYDRMIRSMACIGFEAQIAVSTDKSVNKIDSGSILLLTTAVADAERAKIKQ